MSSRSLLTTFTLPHHQIEPSRCQRPVNVMSHSYTNYYLTHLTVLQLHHLIHVGPEAFKKNHVMDHRDLRQRRVHLETPNSKRSNIRLCVGVYNVPL